MSVSVCAHYKEAAEVTSGYKLHLWVVFTLIVKDTEESHQWMWYQHGAAEWVIFTAVDLAVPSLETNAFSHFQLHLFSKYGWLEKKSGIPL